MHAQFEPAMTADDREDALAQRYDYCDECGRILAVCGHCGCAVEAHEDFAGPCGDCGDCDGPTDIAAMATYPRQTASAGPTSPAEYEDICQHCRDGESPRNRDPFGSASR